MFKPKFRVYDEKSDEIFVAEATAVQGDGRYISLGSKHVRHRSGGEDIISVYGWVEEEGLTFSWFTGWTDRNNDEIFEGDILKRVKDISAERKREDILHNEDYPNLEDYDVNSADEIVDDFSGAEGLVKWRDGGFYIDNLSGHKWAFHGPEGAINFYDWNEIEIIGNKWQDL